MNKLLKELSLQAGGSHYPGINPQLQEAFAMLIIKECITAVQRTDRQHARTYYELDMAEGTIERSIKSITEHFGLKDDFYKPPKSNKNPETK